MKKIIVLFLIFSIINLYGGLYAKERRGVNIEIYKVKPKMEGTPWDESFIKGELIVVKENSLLLLDSKGSDVSVNVADIREIKIVNKPKTVLGAGLGLVIGGAVGTLAGYEGSRIAWQFGKRQFWAFIGGIIGAAFGAMIGVAICSPKTIKFKEKSDTEISKILEDLRKKARVPNF